jgi:hypothetical protein
MALKEFLPWRKSVNKLQSAPHIAAIYLVGGSRDRQNHRHGNPVVRAASRNSMRYSEKTQFTRQIPAVRRTAPPLEKSSAQIEAIAGCDQKYAQADSTKNSGCHQSFDFNLSSCHARKRSCDSSHL